MPTLSSPVDGSTAHSFDFLDPATARVAVSRAQTAQREWCSTPVSERVDLCLQMLHTYGQRLETNAETITRCMGKPLSQARGEYEGGFTERTRVLCELAPRALAPLRPGDGEGIRRYIAREPVGVVLDIAAWNFPLLIAVNVIVPSVLAGNAVLVKHARQTAPVADQLALAFAEAGAPDGLVQAFHAGHDLVADVVRSRQIGYVSFTGSVRGGHEVYRAVAQDAFVGVGLELGGKDAAIVLPDADFEFTVENLVDGAFYNAGQSCCGIERIYVHHELYDRFVEAYAAKVHAYVVGDPFHASTTLGPVVDERAADHVRGQIGQARAAGARSVVDPSRFDVPDVTRCYLAPEVMVDVDHSMALMRDETFGPAVGIMPFRDEDEAVRLANDSAFGLTGSVWTTDLERAEDIARRIAAGTVYANRCDYLDPTLAWTGIKDSGFGCSLSELGFGQVTRPKSYHLRERGRS